MFPGGAAEGCSGGVPCADAVATAARTPMTAHCMRCMNLMALTPFAASRGIAAPIDVTCRRNGRTSHHSFTRPSLRRESTHEPYRRVIFPARRERFPASARHGVLGTRQSAGTRGTSLADPGIKMSTVRFLESWFEGLVRIAIGGGLTWIGAVEGA